ncbi:MULTISPECIES: MIP/aquaporin family protein [unclassified Desulfovibrio]|uniref:MIP/aquaporin family protein n=1 Tax=unclassified Desulfovibrio TaxID=2593640 RepID=UPI0013EA9DD5|nr:MULTISPECIES: MIP/aquaporin family protein [unclassified Desulfovibrio]MBD5626265.1 aquaporin family protein [Desulfovibrio sp.]MDE7370380.1 aquaporin family protein [Desulfovibrio sp.]
METSLFVKCIFELLGTFVMILLGCGVVACCNLQGSKGQGGGWVVITLAWGLAVMCGVLIAGPYSGAHLNPAVSIGLAAAGKFPWGFVIPFIIAQMLGAFLGAVAVYVFYKDHFDATEDKPTKLAVFSTIPAIRNYRRNLVCEVLGTFVLVLVILYMSETGNTAEVGLGSIGAIPVALLVVVIGMSLGGTTGYAINPARDMGPRLAHAALPIKDKGSNDWEYSWIPILGPILGAVTAAIVFAVVKSMM